MAKENSSPINSVSVNNQTNAPVATLDAYSSSGPVSGEQIYELPLTMRLTTDGAKIIDAGATANIALDAGRSAYDLIFCRPADLFPVLDQPEMQDLLDSNYPPITIPGGSIDQATNALTFYVNLLVNPTSNLATQYYQIVQNATNTGTSGESIDQAVQQFFQGTQNFKNLTLSAVVSAQTYARSFAYVWAGYTANFASFANSITYYLYSAGTPPANSNQAPPSLQGTLTLTKSSSPPSQADPTDRTGAYNIVYTDPNGKTTQMQYSPTGFVSDISDFPAIALMGTFITKSSLTNNASDNVIVPILSGTVNGIKVIGVTQKQPDSSSSSDAWGALFHPTTIGEWISLIATMLGLAMGVEWIVSKAKGIVDWFKSRTSPPQPNEIQQMRQQMNDIADQVRTGQQQILDRLNMPNAQVPAEGNMPQAQVEGRQNIVDANNVARGDAQIDQMHAQANQVDVVLEYGANPQINNLAGQIRQNAQDVNQALENNVRGPELQGVVDNVAQNVPQIQDGINAQVQNLGNEISQTNRDTINQQQEIQQEAAKVDEQAKESAEEGGKGEGGQGDDPVDPVEG